MDHDDTLWGLITSEAKDQVSYGWFSLEDRPDVALRRMTPARARELTDEDGRLVLELGRTSTADGTELAPALAETLALRLLHPEWTRRMLRSHLGVEADTLRQRLRQLRKRLPGLLDHEAWPVVPTVAAVDAAHFSR